MTKKEEQILSCVTSLWKAIQEAGGTINHTFLNMTLKDFIDNVAAQNHIEFIYKRKDKENG